MGRKKGSKNKEASAAKVTVHCRTCGKSFERFRSQLASTAVAFCSLECRGGGLEGHVFGYLTVLRQDAERYHGQRQWVCRCECGKEHMVPGAALRKGLVRSCGCKRAELVGKANTTHGMSRGKVPEYKVWGEMIQRCENPNANRYHTHGARGIKVCKRWRESFEAFIEDMGRRPSKDLSIERRDNDGDYEPSNCYWATRTEQSRNQRRSIHLTVNGVTKHLLEWAEITGIKYGTLWYRLKKGATPEEAIKK